MIDYKSIISSAPKMPSYKATWAPIYFEPMMGSGERFTVAVAAHGVDGKVRVCNSIRPHVIKAMYGNKQSQFNELISLIITSIEIYLQKNNSFDGWISPVVGASLGKVNRANSSDMTGILRQAIQISASLSSLDFFASEDENDERYSSENTWANQLKQQIISSNPSFENYFNISFKVVGEGRPSKMFFLSSQIAVNTDRLIPANLSVHFDRNKARLLDLISLKDHDFLERKHYEFIVYRPHNDDPTYSKQQFLKLNEAILSLEEIGDKRSIRVAPVTTVYHAAQRIIKAELAA